MATYIPKVIETSPKMIVLFQIIEDSLALNDKMIIFSQSLLTLNMIERGLEMKFKWKKNLQYFRIDGTTSQQSRQNMIQKFNQNSSSKVFLLSTRAACLGITLVGANRVVLMDVSFNPSDDLQAVGRVYRYGQTKHTFIYKFVMDNSLEKAIFEHQIRKQQITKVVVDQQNPEPYMSLENATSSYFQYEENVQTKEISCSSDYYDSVLNDIVTNYSTLFTEEPMLHESLLIDKEEYKLSKSESLLAFTSFKAAKRSFDSTSHNNSSCSTESDSQQSEQTYSSRDNSSRDNSSSFSIDSDSQRSESTVPEESIENNSHLGDVKGFSTSSDDSHVDIEDSNMDEEDD